MISFRTDLAEELRTHAMGGRDRELSGIRYLERTEDDIRISTVDITHETGERELGKPKGRYVTLTFGGEETLFGSGFFTLCDKLAREIRALLKDAKSILVVGLGNGDLSADAVGVIAASFVPATRHLKKEDAAWFQKSGLFDLSVLFPYDAAKMGIDTLSLVRFAIKDLRPDAVIAVDALAARDSARLLRTIQLANTGIIPGSGLGRGQAALNEKTLGVPTLAIGVPTVVDTETLLRDALQQAGLSSDLAESPLRGFVSSKDVDVTVKNMGKLIGFSIGRAFHTALSYEELLTLLTNCLHLMLPCTQTKK